MIPFNRPYYGKHAIDHVRAAIDGASLQGGGEPGKQLAARLSAIHGGRAVLLTASCTSALEVAARAAGFGTGDEVVVPAYSFASTAGAIAATGATPVFVDVAADNLCIDLDAAERAVTTRTRGIMAVHYAGQACDLERLRQFCDTHALIAIEDAAHALFCRQRQHLLGTVGQFGCFSFQNGKVFAAGEGGALVVNDRKFLKRAVQILNKGTNYQEFVDREVASYGWSGEGMAEFMGGLPAALLGAQIDECDDIIERRKAIFDAYDAALGDAMRARGWRVIRWRDDEVLTSSVYWLVCRDPAERTRFSEALAAKGVAVWPHFPALHRSARAREMGWEPTRPLPVAEEAADSLARLPLYPTMTDSQVGRVIALVREYLESNSG